MGKSALSKNQLTLGMENRDLEDLEEPVVTGPAQGVENDIVLTKPKRMKKKTSNRRASQLMPNTSDENFVIKF
jgi:hypothetical protein